LGPNQKALAMLEVFLYYLQPQDASYFIDVRDATDMQMLKQQSRMCSPDLKCDANLDLPLEPNLGSVQFQGDR
jgi:hypothetical protein